jgi:hypothetical protein
MKQFVTIEGRALKQAMTLMRAVVERRNTIPILSYVKLTHSDVGLRIVGTDLDMEIIANLEVIDGAGGEWSLCLGDGRVRDSRFASSMCPETTIEQLGAEGAAQLFLRSRTTTSMREIS